MFFNTRFTTEHMSTLFELLKILLLQSTSFELTPDLAQTLPDFAQTLSDLAQTLPDLAQTLPDLAQTLPKPCPADIAHKAAKMYVCCFVEMNLFASLGSVSSIQTSSR